MRNLLTFAGLMLIGSAVGCTHVDSGCNGCGGSCSGNGDYHSRCTGGVCDCDLPALPAPKSWARAGYCTATVAFQLRPRLRLRVTKRPRRRARCRRPVARQPTSNPRLVQGPPGSDLLSIRLKASFASW